MREPVGIAHNTVELVTVKNKQIAPVSCAVNDFITDIDACEVEAGIIPERFIMVAGDVNDIRPMTHLVQDFLNHGVVTVVPKPGPFDPPAIDYVPDQIDGLGFIIPKEIQQEICLASRCSKMDVGQEKSSVSGGTSRSGRLHDPVEGCLPPAG